MSATPSASIVIPTYRREALLRDLIISLAAQKTSYEYDVTVVGDGTEVSADTVGPGAGDLRIRFISLPEKVGRGAARNAGISASTGDVVVFLDDDMTVVEGFLEAHMKNHATAGAGQAATAGDNTVVIGDVLSPPEYSKLSLARYIERQGVRKLASRADIPPKCFRTGNASVARSLLERAGMFDESIKHYGEDMDLAVKLADAGARFVFSEEAAAFHHHPPDIDDMILKMREYGKYTVPVLVERHPYLRTALRIHLAEPPQPGAEPLSLTMRKVGLRLALTPPVYGLVLAAMQFNPPDALMFPMYDYVRAYNYIREYWAVKREEERVRRRLRGDFDPTQ
jgi:GT2 family glycosyltransferase